MQYEFAVHQWTNPIVYDGQLFRIRFRLQMKQTLTNRTMSSRSTDDHLDRRIFLVNRASLQFSFDFRLELLGTRQHNRTYLYRSARTMNSNESHQRMCPNRTISNTGELFRQWTSIARTVSGYRKYNVAANHHG